MSTHEVLTKIFEYCDKHIQYLNCGGCAKVFTLVAKEMLKRNIRFDLVLADPTIHYTKDDRRAYVENVEKLLNEVRKKDVYVSASHVFFTYESQVYNSEGFSKEEAYVINGANNLKLLVDKLNNSYRVKKISIWNDLYNVKQNKKLRRAIKYYFNKLD